MGQVEQIVNELLAVDSDISAYTVRLERERGELTNTINKAQSTFGNQQEAMILVTTLYKTVQSIVNADTALYLARQEIKKYIQNLQK